MTNSIEVQGLRKSYGDFSLRDINLTVPGGAIMGLIGENGAGKTTTIKCILNLIRRDEGTITLLGHDNQREERAAKLEIGVVLDECFFHDSLRPRDIDLILSRIYQGWDSALYQRYLSKFQLPERKFVKEFSRGMKMKLSLAAALSHRPKLLILDEATSGLDPIVRDEILDEFLGFIQDDDHAILISSHILSELSALATHYAFIDQGRMLETISAADLRERCRDCLELRVDDAARAARVLEEQLGTRDFEVLPQERLRLYAFLDQPQTVNRVLMEEGVGLISAQQKDSNLEDYFLSLIDGHSAGKEGA